ncbi:hypothetical protein TcWFU_007726 [Taenia crassiceps]|uniref:Uncharacterized protein n=1 Tax=Taenia crassiceps TaxID=6207 RepID=A0ABR4QHH9_9CEST
METAPISVVTAMVAEAFAGIKYHPSWNSHDKIQDFHLMKACDVSYHQSFTGSKFGGCPVTRLVPFAQKAFTNCLEEQCLFWRCNLCEFGSKVLS